MGYPFLQMGWTDCGREDTTVASRLVNALLGGKEVPGRMVGDLKLRAAPVVGKTSRLHSLSGRADVKPVESNRNLSVIA